VYRALVAGVVIIAAETVHGVLRQLLLVPIVGDLRARQIGVLIGSAIIFAIAWALARWIDARSLRPRVHARRAGARGTCAPVMFLREIPGFPSRPFVLRPAAWQEQQLRTAPCVLRARRCNRERRDHRCRRLDPRASAIAGSPRDGPLAKAQGDRHG
jgi:hypothetical protein